jgi:CRISPR-associated protein Cas1
MPVVYIADQGSHLCKRGDRLYVYRGTQLLRWFHTKDIIQLILVGNIGLTSQVVTYLLKYRIDTVFLSYYGKFKGRLVGEFGKNVLLRVNQFQYLSDLENRTLLANLISRGKIANSLFHLAKRKKRNKEESITVAYIKNKALLAQLNSQIYPKDILLGYEGIAAKNYFAAFPALIANNDFPFSGRNKRPPKDEVNAMLSLSYTFLMNQVMCSAYICGLDPYYGALHDLDYGRQSLVLDVMEEFRPLIDNMVISLINRKEIRLEHFLYNTLPNDEDPEEENSVLPVSLTKDGMKIIITAFSKLINSKFPLQDLPGEWSMKDIITLQIRKLAAHFENKKEYLPFLWM